MKENNKTSESNKDRQLVKLWQLLKNLGMKKSTRRQVKVERTVTFREIHQEKKKEDSLTKKLSGS